MKIRSISTLIFGKRLCSSRVKTMSRGATAIEKARFREGERADADLRDSPG
jgi:hypothetical protein